MDLEFHATACKRKEAHGPGLDRHTPIPAHFQVHGGPEEVAQVRRQTLGCMALRCMGSGHDRSILPVGGAGPKAQNGPDSHRTLDWGAGCGILETQRAAPPWEGAARVMAVVSDQSLISKSSPWYLPSPLMEIVRRVFCMSAAPANGLSPPALGRWALK